MIIISISNSGVLISTFVLLPGALNLTRLAGDRSRKAQVKVEYTQVIVSESERYRKQTENILIYKADRFNRTIQDNEAALNAIDGTLLGMEDEIPELNQMVCRFS